jgi:hypothetical protein
VEEHCRAGQATYGNVAHAEYLRLQTHTVGMDYSVLMQSNNGCTNAPHYYVIRTLLVLFNDFLVGSFMCYLFCLLSPHLFGYFLTTMGQGKYEQQ